MTDKVLFVVTSTDTLGDTGKGTGFHFSEMADPYYVLTDAGFEVEIASTRGGAAPIDNEKSRGENPQSVERFLDDAAAMAKVRATTPVDEVHAEDYAGIYFPGGHGTMWDFPHHAALGRLVSRLFDAGKLVAAVCHGPAAFIGPTRADGEPLVKGKRVNSFSDAEERKVELDGVVPFLLESKLRELGGKVEVAEAFQPIVVEDGNLITGQNPASAQPLAERMVAWLKEARANGAA